MQRRQVHCEVSWDAAGTSTGLLIQTSLGSCATTGLPRTKRSGCAVYAASRASWRLVLTAP